MKGEQRKRHTEEFKQEAVRLVTEEGYTTTEAARNLGINANMLGRWKREMQEVDFQAFYTYYKSPARY